MGEAATNPPVPDRELFSYTSGRYLYNEKLRLAERYIQFNIGALKRIAARSVSRERVVHLKKLAEGGFNRVLLLTMEDGLEVIVKIPFSIAEPKGLATESEVATLDFLRSKGVPVPRVYAWSSQAENEVGGEYIIMEKATGNPLRDRWFGLTEKEQIRLVTSYAEIECTLFSLPFGSYGSIYYKDNLPQNIQADLYAAGVEDKDNDADRFCIGDLGDAPTIISTPPAGKKGNGLANMGRPKPTIFLTTIYSKEKFHLSYLNPTNIYVSDSCEISCIIDWQHTTILPLLLAAGNPPLFENPDPEPPRDYAKPQLPADYESLGPHEKSQADELHRRRMLFYWYMIFNTKDNKPHFNALRYPFLMLIQHLVDRAGRPWTGNTVTLKGALLRVVNSWDALMSTKSDGKVLCPVHFKADDARGFYELEDGWFKCNILVEHWRSLLDDLGQDGWVRSESFERVVEVNRQLKKEWIDQAENEKDFDQVVRFWPFQDHVEDE
ncbi:Phosphotransferase enzyme [Onygenales sp. PD_10]|nr:Phosphotransferase enzyme [Onygenales sp. PD_10]